MYQERVCYNFAATLFLRILEDILTKNVIFVLLFLVDVNNQS